MGNITDADREAARILRDTLADASGFWHNCGDESALCLALARHRIAAESRTSQAALRYGRNAFPVFGPDRLIFVNHNDASLGQPPASAA